MKFIKKLSLPIVFVLIFSILAGVFPQSTDANPFSSKSFATKSFSSAHQLNDAEIIPGQVIVKYKQLVKSEAAINTKTIGIQTKTIYFSKNISVRDKIAQLERDPNVEYAEPDYKVQMSAFNDDGSVTGAVYFDVNNPSYMHNWGKTVTQITYAQELTTSSSLNSVIVAIIDSGVYMDHPDLVGAKIPDLTGWDFIDNDNTPQDDNGHGTNVAGIVAANGSGYSGVAPGTKILPVKVLDANGGGSTSQVIAGINYAVTHGADIINLSLGSTKSSEAMHEAIQDAVHAGVLVVAAAGNEGNNHNGSDPGNIWDIDENNKPFGGKYAANTDYPAAYPEVISVGATEQLPNGSIVIADFSNVGKIDVVAPGVNIYSTYPAPDNYKYMSGTSQATPIVAGFAALLKANNPALDVERLTTIIKESAAPFDDVNVIYQNGIKNSLHIYGYGLINAQEAFQQPRLDITAATKFDGNHNVTLTVSAKDYQGATSPVTSSVYGRLYQISEDDPSNFMTLKSEPIINLLNGEGAIVLTNPVPTSSFYHYFISVDDDLESTKYISSKAIGFVNRPSVPTPDKSTGTYSGSQQITLSSTANDSIYYSMDNRITTQHYVGPFTINQNSTLLTYALKDHVYSDEGEFTYVINQVVASPPPTTGTDNSGGCGFCGFIPFFPPALDESPTPAPKPSENLITKGGDGKYSLEVKPNKDYLIDLLDKSKDDVIIDAKSTQSLDAVFVSVDGNVMLKAKEKGTPIIIQSNDLQIHFAPDTIDYKDSKANVKFSASISQDQTLPTNMQSISTIYDFNLSVDNVAAHTFNKPIKVHFTIDPTKIHNLNHVGVFYYNETKKAWEYVGGTVNKDNTVTALLPHFSKYAVLENSKSFNDIQGYWAKAEIEEMAAKQIISGMTEETFQPKLNITRAQFVSLLSRSLRLESSSEGMIFNDIPETAWYKKDVYSAFNANIIKGITEHTFAPEEKITREQLATLLVNAYLKSTGKQLSDIVTTQEVKYTDEGSISNWARSNVRIATSLGLMSGVGNGRFNPSGNATRAEAAVVLKRFLDLVK